MKYICFVKNTFKNETHLLLHIHTEKIIYQSEEYLGLDNINIYFSYNNTNNKQ